MSNRSSVNQLKPRYKDIYSRLSFIVFVVMVLQVLLLLPVNSYANITEEEFKKASSAMIPDPDEGGCDAVLDFTKPWDPLSCVSRGIGYQDYKLKVEYEPFGGIFGDTSGVIKVGDCKYLGGMPFCVEIEGDKACAYGLPYVTKFAVGAGHNPTYSKWKGKEHCRQLPAPPSKLKPPAWSRLISPVCTNYDASASRFYKRNPDGTLTDTKASFIGVAIECIEDTISNIFTARQGTTSYDRATEEEGGSSIIEQKEGEGVTFFQVVQRNFKNLVSIALTLYIIIYAIRIIVSQKMPAKDDFIWFFIRFGMVIYFAIGPGMASPDSNVNVYNALIGGAKDLSAIMLEAGLDDEENLQANLDSLSANTDKTQLPDEMLQPTPLRGYNYCDFRDAMYPEGKRFYRIWDMVDCKLSKYLGVGDMKNQNTPKILVMVLTAVFSTPYGLLILVLGLFFIQFLILVTMRIVHLYIMFFLTIAILVYFSPLIIPTVLFPFTKSIFQAWLKQLIANTLQPIILFAFLAMIFGIVDRIVYGGNHLFNEADRLIMTVDSETNTYSCFDPDTIGCIFERTAVGTMSDTYEDIENTDDDTPVIKHVDMMDGIDIIFGTLPVWSSGFSGITGDGLIIFLEMLKLTLVLWIVGQILGTVEDLTRRLADGAIGMAGMSPLKPASVTQVAKGTAAIANRAEITTRGVVLGVARTPSAVGSIFSSERTPNRFGRAWDILRGRNQQPPRQGGGA